ncbi:MAG: twin-arginine translocase TatA/TatE family subunit [Myxococcales bacterium]|nr:twin-arginine translocase TatA/TatE family subunit [Myxococcales bacterium]|tara:strand:+ start:664 stop:942 length:279 start_codon:yes stop_codon:yes gene_type:complete
MKIDAALLPGGYEWIVILVVVLIFFGPKKLPELARGLGKGLREFRQASDEMVDTIKNADLEEPRELPSASESLPVTPSTEAAEAAQDRSDST